MGVISFVDLRRQYVSIKSEVDQAVLRVLDSGRYILGEEVAAFEREFADYCGVADAVAVNSGTSALHMALLALGVGPGDEVITVPHTFVATVAAILYTGARPVFVDVDPLTYTIDVNQVEQAVTSRTRVILPVHIYGLPADLDPLNEIAVRHGLFVVEDAAQAHGAVYKGRRVGSIGDLGCFSFYPTKNLGGCGEGGVITTKQPCYAERLRRMRNWGAKDRYDHEQRGFNHRMDAIQAAILRVKLRHLDKWVESRRRLAAAYDDFLGGSDVLIPEVPPTCGHAYHIYAIRTKDRDVLRSQLAGQGIEASVHYPVPVHCQSAYRDLGYRMGEFPDAEGIAAEELSLPLFPELSLKEVETVALSVLSGQNGPSRGAWTPTARPAATVESLGRRT